VLIIGGSGGGGGDELGKGSEKVRLRREGTLAFYG